MRHIAIVPTIHDKYIVDIDLETWAIVGASDPVTAEQIENEFDSVPIKYDDKTVNEFEKERAYLYWFDKASWDTTSAWYKKHPRHGQMYF